MADEIRINRVVQPAGGVRPEVIPSGEPVQPSRGQSKLPWVILVVVVIVLVVIAVLFRDKLFKSGSKETAVVKASAYQAVFLTNGQVYFGKLSNLQKDWVTLKEIYYLQVIQPPLQGQQQPGAATTTQQQPQISLVKLGNELHGPVDEMQIVKGQVLFYEDLKEDSQVVKAIKDYKANPQGVAPAPVPAQ